VVEVPIVFHDRHKGQSKMTKRIIAEAFWTVLAMRIRVTAIAGRMRIRMRFSA
jgi:hypothetical protein